RVGQRFIAWEAFERASKLADRFWPGQVERDALRDHCLKRQARIEGTLMSGEESPRVPGLVADLRSQFESELAFGEAYQKAYQDFEAAKIAAGGSIEDE